MRTVRFSERIGVTKPVPMQLEGMSSSLKNSLWNLILTFVFSEGYSLETRHGQGRVQFIWDRCLKLPRDGVLEYGSAYTRALKDIFYKNNFQWWEVYNLLEFIVEHPLKTIGRRDSERFMAAVNGVLQEEASGYRFVGGLLTPITNASEMHGIEDSLAATRQAGLPGASEHLETAIALMAKRPDPDYRNSIKESISALESLVKQLTGEHGGGLDKALAKLDKEIKFHGGFKSALLGLYGYTSDEGGIRHPIIEAPEVGLDEAKFMLVACSAIVNFIIAKSGKRGITSARPRQ